MQTHQGSCHCQAVTFEVDLDLETVMECNCSICATKKFLLVFVPEENFRLLTGKDMLTEYRFNKKHVAHLFCKVCGVQSFGRGSKPDGTKLVAVNVRCLHDIDLDTLTINQVDGKNF